MGMFDHLYINKNKLPITDEEKKNFPESISWQTKSLDCILTEIYITDEGRLLENSFS